MKTATRRLSSEQAQRDYGSTPLNSKMNDETNIAKLEKLVAYYERLHADARKGIEIAISLSGEMKERKIQAMLRLESAKRAQGTK